MNTPISEFVAGSSTAGTEAQPLTLGRTLYHGVTVSIDPASEASLFVGHSEQSCLYRLTADAPSIFIPIDNCAKVFVRASAPDTGYQWVAA